METWRILLLNTPETNFPLVAQTISVCYMLQWGGSDAVAPATTEEEGTWKQQSLTERTQDTTLIFSFKF